MKKLNLLTLMLTTFITTLSHASYDYLVYKDLKGMPHCLEMGGGNGASIIISWDHHKNLESRKVFYRRFDRGDVCKNWHKYDPNILRFDSRLIEFSNGKAPEYLDEFTLDSNTKRALGQIAVGMNRFLPEDSFQNANFLKSIFEPFFMKTHQDLLSEVGANITTELYHSYTKSIGLTKDCSELIGTCEYYLCREQNKACGSQGYFLGFGYQYCSDSLKRLINEVSPVGKKWLKATATCLHQQMEEVKDDNSCGEIKKQAIRSHDKCYSEVSFCSLKFSDMLKILKMIRPALTERGVVAEGVQVLGHCAGI